MKKTGIIAVLILLPIFFFSLVKPMYALEEVQGEGKWDLKAGWEAVVTLGSALTDNLSEDIQKLLAKMGYTITANLIAEAAPQLTTSYEDIVKADIPPAMKYGFVGVVDNQLMAMFNTYPRIDVIAHLSNEWVPGYEETQSVYAGGYEDLQGSGVDSLWSRTRDIAYLGFVLIMIGIGFMIMFRSKIGGQTLVTLGNSIPRVVIALILATFSFAIIGLIIDISGVLMSITKAVLDVENAVNPMNLFEMLKGIIGIEGAGIVETITTFSGISVVGTVLLAIPIIGRTASFFWNLVVLVILGIVTYGVIKLWFVLVKAYLGLLVNVIVAPLSIMAGAFPGNQQMTGNLFKSVLRNALVFPVAFAIINLPFTLDPGQVSLNFPETWNPDALLDLNIGKLILAVAKIIAIYVAAQSPIFLKSIIPASAPKSGVDVAVAVKQGLTKMPLFGGLFKDKK